MADIAQGLRFTVDLRDGLIQRPQRGVLMRGDKNANKIVVTVTDGDAQVSLTGAVVSGTFVRQSGLQVPLTGGASGNVITVTLNEHCYVESGHYEAFVRLKAGSALRTILLISGEVHRDGDGAVVDVENVIPSLDDLLAQLEEMRRVTAAANTATTNANRATTSANNAASSANAAASGANAAKNAANAAAAKIDGMTVSASGRGAGQAPTAAVSETGGHKHIAFGIPKGDTGSTPNLTIGTVTTGAPGTNAGAAIRGTAEDPVLDLTIPRGNTGSLGNLTVNGEAPDASGRIVVKRLYESTGESYARLRYQDAVLPYIEVTGGGEYAGADFALRKEIDKKGIVCRYRESANDEYHYDRVYTTENPPPYPVTKVNNKTGEIIVDHLRRTATGFRVSLGGNEENWALNALTQDNKNKSILFVNSNTGAITLYYGYADDNTTHETARVYTEKAPPPSDIVAVGSQATLSVNGTITLSRSIKNARFIQVRVNYIGTTGSLSGANPQVIDFAVISSTSDTVDMKHAFFTLSSDGLTLTFKSGERVRINKNTLYMSCEALTNVTIGPVYAVF